MSDEDDKAGRRSYHHGNLREALVDAVLGLIAKHGPNGFSFADAARAAGVSPAAPYRHFKDRDALLAEVARQGFERLTDSLERALASGGPSPMRAFEAVMQAYLAFARHDRAAWSAMFAPGPRVGDVAEAADRALAVLRLACEGLVRHLPPEGRPPVHMMTYHLWAMAYGVTEHYGTENARRRAPIAAEEMMEAGAAIYLRGLGLIPED